METELFERVEKYGATRSSWRNKFDSVQYKEASKLNQLLTGKPLNKSVGCECVDDLYFLMKRKNFKQIIVDMQNKQFHLKEGIVIMLHGCTPVSSQSTDEVLIKLLSKYPGQIVRFTKTPDNWREICGLDGAEPVNTKAPAKEEYKVEKGVASLVDETNNEQGNLSEREEELLTKSNQALKDILLKDLKVELPEKVNKVNLVNAVLEAEKA